jgi:hypothetical protein
MGDARYDSTLNRYVGGPDATEVTLQPIDGAITHVPGKHALTKGSIGAYTLSVPTAAEAGTRLCIVSRTAFAHVLTVAGGLGGNAADNVLTFAKVGDNIELEADGLFWVPVGAPYGVVIS